MPGCALRTTPNTVNSFRDFVAIWWLTHKTSWVFRDFLLIFYRRYDMKVGWSPPCLKGPSRHNPLLIFGWTIGPMFPMVKGAVWWQCRVVWAIDLAVSHNGWLGWRLMIRIWSARHYWDQHSSRPAQAEPGKTRALAPECRWWLFLVVVVDNRASNEGPSEGS